MNIRELLQIEIWGKRTTRKILVVFGIVFAIAVVGFGALYLVEVNWLTRGERSAAKAALVQIDALQDAGPLSDEEFKVRQDQADAKVQAAKDVAKTLKDDSTQEMLFWYLAGVELERSKIQNKKRTEELVQQGRTRRRNTNEENEKKIDALLSDLKHAGRAALHKELD
jgi:hypothetical protein